ncbi:MAG TPA: hypothetical protein VES38_01905 [Methylotenera sp.]|nr:hypothetical protein [Methylotenera sp.]
MSHKAITSTEALHSFTLTHEQVNHIAVSLASDIGAAESLMLREFLDSTLNYWKCFFRIANGQRAIKNYGRS